MKLEEEDYVRFGILACKIDSKRKPQTEKRKGTIRQQKIYQGGKKTSNEATSGNRPSSTRPASVVSASNQWLVGRILIPNRCGDAFKFQIDAFGSFNDTLNNHKKAAHAYLHVLTHGVKLINSFKVACANSRPLPRPLSGKKLDFNNEILEQATYEMGPFYRHEGSPSESSQGELLSLRLTPAVWNKMSIAHGDLIVFGRCCDKVMVKVSSIPIFNPLCAPLDVFLTMKSIASKKLPVFKEALLAMCRTQVGLITVLRDLRSELHCTDLSPFTYTSAGGELSDLWNRFEAFVDKWIIPMAREGVIHTDIRPGYDLTANIMIEPNGTMWPIDFESVVKCEMYVRPPLDIRYFDQNVASSAFDFAVVQCIAIGYTWLTKTTQMALDGSEIGGLRSYLFGREKMGTVSESDLRHVLQSIGSLVHSKHVFETLSDFAVALKKEMS